MKFKASIAAPVALFLGAPHAAAQVQYDTSQLDQRADVERNRILLDSTVRRKGRPGGDRVHPRGTQAQAQACAGRARFRRDYGANNPKVRRLEALCAQAGY